MNVDAHTLKFHREAYSLQFFPFQSHPSMVEMQRVVLNGKSIQLVYIQNQMDVELKLSCELSNHDHLALFEEGVSAESVMSALQTEEIREETRQKLVDAFQSTPDRELDRRMGSGGQKDGFSQDFMSLELSAESLSLATYMEAFVMLATLINDRAKLESLEDEEAFVRSFLRFNTFVDRCIAEKAIVPCQTFRLEPKEKKLLILIFSPRSEAASSFAHSVLRGIEEMLYFNLNNARELHFKESSYDVVEMPLQPLGIFVQGHVCSSMLEIQMQSIHVGDVELTDVVSKSLKIKNKGESTVLFRIRKSGTAASGDLQLACGKYGLVPPYAEKTLTFTLQPSVVGPYREAFQIENLNDATNLKEIVVKANVLAPKTFEIRGTYLDFGIVDPDTPSKGRRITIRNLRDQRKKFELFLNDDLSPEDCIPDFAFIVEESMKGIEVSKVEEKITFLEHKLRIAKRKGKLQKANDLEKELEKVKSLLEEGEVIIPQNGTDSGSDSMSQDEDDRKQKGVTHMDNGITFSINGREERSVVIYVDTFFDLPDAFEDSLMKVQGSFSVLEVKNRDGVKTIPFSLIVHPGGIEISGFESPKRKRDYRTASEPVHHLPSPLDMEISSSLFSEDKTMNLRFEKEKIDFGTVRVGSTQEILVPIRNSSRHRIAFDVMGSFGETKNLQVIPVSGLIAPLSRRQLRFICHPQSFGAVKDTIFIHNRTEEQDDCGLSVHFQGERECPLSFPTLGEDKQFDFGVVHCSESLSETSMVKVPIMNVSPENLVVEISTNLSNQISVHMDENLEQSAQNILMESGTEITPILHVRLRGLRGDVTSKELVGGLHVSVKGMDGEVYCVVHIPFRMLTVISGLNVLTPSIHLGRGNGGDPVHGNIVIENKNDRVSLELTLMASENIRIKDGFASPIIGVGAWVGGLHVSVKGMDGEVYCVVHIPFRMLTVISGLNVLTPSIHLGRGNGGDPVHGNIVIENKNDRVSLELTLMASENIRIKDGFASPIIGVGEKMHIPIEMIPKLIGFNQGYVEVADKHCLSSCEKIRIHYLRKSEDVFVEESVGTDDYVVPLSFGEHALVKWEDIEELYQSGPLYDEIWWKSQALNVFLSNGQDSDVSDDLRNHCFKITIRNVSDEDVQCKAKATMTPLVLLPYSTFSFEAVREFAMEYCSSSIIQSRWDLFEIAKDDDFSEYKDVSPWLLIPAHSVVELCGIITRRVSLHKEQIHSLWTGNDVPFKTTITFEKRSSEDGSLFVGNGILDEITLNGRFCMSLIHLMTPSSISLGSLGDSNMWGSVPFWFSLGHATNVQTNVRIELEDEVLSFLTKDPEWSQNIMTMGEEGDDEEETSMIDLEKKVHRACGDLFHFGFPSAMQQMCKRTFASNWKMRCSVSSQKTRNGVKIS
eukprot:TRINITY_DN26196_c0_g1_i1.p1 TRINITY_DN26196_c0_g1~~TRINITY_DN26196_c0_g1_i1.p1  ORF type:complete len:1446 (-),score=388.99 TRINITY_DN26196_c0_g1_i1:2952-7136(-)